MKKFLSLLLASLMILSLTACGQKEEPAASASTPVVEDTAKEYPYKPIKCIVPFTAGGGTDVIARMMGSLFPNYIGGQSLVVENQAGGASVPGTLAVATENDEYTLGYSWQAAWTLRQFIMDTGYTMDDFTIICGIELQHNGVYVNADSPFQTLEDLVTYAKEHPGELNYSTGPAASYQELVANAFMDASGVEAYNVPYEGARQAALGMMASELDFTILQATTYTSELSDGSVRMLCNFEEEPYKEGVPTIAECGYEGITFVHRGVVYGPANMSEEAVSKLEKAFEGICSDETFLKLAGNSQADIQFVGHEEITAATKADAETGKAVVEATWKF